MKRVEVIRFLRDTLVAMHDAGLNDVQFSLMGDCGGEGKSEEISLTLAATCDYLDALIIEATSEEPDEIKEIDWQDLVTALDYIRSYRLLGNWDMVEQMVDAALRRWLPDAPFALERISLWDLILHADAHYDRKFGGDSRTRLFSETGQQTINALVNGGVPPRNELRQVVNSALEFLNNTLLELQASSTAETEPQFSGLGGDYEFLDQDDQPQNSDDISPPTEEHNELACLQELCSDLDEEWELFQAVYAASLQQ